MGTEVEKVFKKKETVKFYKNKRQIRRKFEERELERIQEECEKIHSADVNAFSDFPISSKTLRGLADSEYAAPTEIQRESLVHSLKGLDVLGAAKTGSGKTLAFLIPILEDLYRKKWTHSDGTGAIVITPTRELAYQIFECLRKVGRYHDFSAGLIIGGKDLHFEKRRMDQCNIVICTPGRLLQHMDENPLFSCDNMQILILDEADRCLDMGFEQTMNSIIENLPVKRQTLLFSATQTKSVRDLARLSLKDPMYVSVHEHARHSTPEGLRQSYVVCALPDKVALLWSFLRNHNKSKILVFFSSCKQVKFHYEVFCRMRPGLSLLALYGSLHQLKRMAIYDSFCRKSNAVLFATDIAARGLDFPAVHWVLQLDCPEDATAYIHRAGRTARYQSGGESLLVLLPSEEAGAVKQLAERRIPIMRIEVNPKKLQNPQRKMEALLARDPALKDTAQRAFVAYIKAVYLMGNKEVFDVHALDTDAYSRSLGLAVPPKVRFLKKALQRRQQQLQQQQPHPSPAPASDADAALRKPEAVPSDDSDGESDGNGGAGTLRPAAPTTGRPTGAFGQADSDSSDGEVLQLKRRDHDIDDSLLPPLPDGVAQRAPARKGKALTKVAVAKKVLKKKIVANTKIVFDDEGKPVLDGARQKLSAEGREYEGGGEGGGIDIDHARRALRAEDRFDKQLFQQRIKAQHREQRLKLRAERTGRSQDEPGSEDSGEDSGGDSDSSGPDLSWLPDPDRLYGPQSSDEGGTDSDPNLPPPAPSKRKATQPPAASKKQRSEPTADLALMADEELALQFLQNG